MNKKNNLGKIILSILGILALLGFELLAIYSDTQDINLVITRFFTFVAFLPVMYFLICGTLNSYRNIIRRMVREELDAIEKEKSSTLKIRTSKGEE